MPAEAQPEPSLQEQQIRAALDLHWHASATGDAEAEHDIYTDGRGFVSLETDRLETQDWTEPAVAFAFLFIIPEGICV
jgi:hypothetical protein